VWEIAKGRFVVIPTIGHLGYKFLVASGYVVGLNQTLGDVSRDALASPQTTSQHVELLVFAE
jgi:hypothetical protein